MAGVRQGATIEEEQAGNAAPSALRIDTDVFTVLTAAVGDGPPIVGWFDRWRP